MLRALAAWVLAAAAAFAQPIPLVPSMTGIERRFAELKKNPLELHAFLYRMPKGGDLHNHLAGAVYAETFLKAAAAEHLCIDRAALAIAHGPCEKGLVDAALAQTDNDLRNEMIDSLSMRNFVPGKESAHDHFFATFNKFGAVDSGDFVAEIAQRAGDQNESYVEVMALSGGEIAELGKTAGLDTDFDVTRQKLEAAGLGRYVAAAHARVDEMEAKRQRTLGCRETPGSPACQVQVRYVYQVLREFPKEQVFAQVLEGFAIASSDPRVVSVNFVQPEDGVTSMADYRLQMKMVAYAKGVYPTVHLTLHAGELAPGLVPPEGLRFHIREAVETAHAERIGHGVDIMYETDAAGLLKEMREKHILVEINLTSNDVILGVSGERHPFPLYRKAGVPVALCTDDEGVSRGELTDEYQRAVLTYNLTYADLKEMARNSLEYSFAAGGSYWNKGSYSSPVAPCVAGRKQPLCFDYLHVNEKARIEADLENRFSEFEQTIR